MKKCLTPLFLVATASIAFIGCDDEGQTIKLPATVQTYLDTNYPKAEIEESEQEKLCTGATIYEVKLEVEEDKTKDLTFSAEGVLLFTESEIDASALPAAVTASVTANYPSHTIAEAEVLDMADGSKQYEVELKNGTQTSDVLFLADGTKVCEEAGDDGDEE